MQKTAIDVPVSLLRLQLERCQLERDVISSSEFLLPRMMERSNSLMLHSSPVENYWCEGPSVVESGLSKHQNHRLSNMIHPPNCETFQKPPRWHVRLKGKIERTGHLHQVCARFCLHVLNIPLVLERHHVSSFTSRNPKINQSSQLALNVSWLMITHLTCLTMRK